MNSSEETSTCPTESGLSSSAGFNPGLDWASVKEDPTANWHVIGWLVCLLFLLITWIVTFTTLFRHLRNYYNPEIQRHKLRVILFPPVYATLSWFAYLRYDYATTINFFATCFEAFAVYNLYTCLQAYLQPFRDENEEIQMGNALQNHYKFLVLQYPVWSLIDAFMSIFAELKGRYCDGVYSFKGAYVYLTIIDFISLSIILTALFTYLDVFHSEWQRGKIRAHGMFWCVKGPIMVIFYFGEILLTILTTVGVIKGTDGSHGSIAWSADAVKNGLYVIIVCVCMMVVSCMMAKFFSPADNIEAAMASGEKKQKGMFGAFIDGYVAYIPEFLYKMICCGVDSVKLAKKRKALKKRKTLGDESMPVTNDTNGLLRDDYMDYRMQEVNHESQPSADSGSFRTNGLPQYPKPSNPSAQP
ncbi:unnamed protein product [Rhizopus stolonifer]